jgi:Mg-chelatase subunit ChlD
MSPPVIVLFATSPSWAAHRSIVAANIYRVLVRDALRAGARVSVTTFARQVYAWYECEP